MINIMYAVDPIKRIVKPMSGHAVTEQDHEASSLRFAFPDNIAGTGLDSTGTAVRVMYIRPDGGDPVAKTLTFYKHSGGYYLYDWNLQKSDLQKEGHLVFSLCILDISSGEVSEWHTTPCQIRVLDTIHTDDSDEEDETITPTVAQRVAVLEASTQRLYSIVGGAPEVVSSTSDMTDEEKLYVLTTDGCWYYYDGSAWVAGGEYGAVATDITLTRSGIPADGKTVGDAINPMRTATDSDAGKALKAKTVTDGKVTEWEFESVDFPENIVCAEFEYNITTLIDHATAGKATQYRRVNLTQGQTAIITVTTASNGLTLQLTKNDTVVQTIIKNNSHVATTDEVFEFIVEADADTLLSWSNGSNTITLQTKELASVALVDKEGEEIPTLSKYATKEEFDDAITSLTTDVNAKIGITNKAVNWHTLLSKGTSGGRKNYPCNIKAGTHLYITVTTNGSGLALILLNGETIIDTIIDSSSHVATADEHFEWVATADCDTFQLWTKSTFTLNVQTRASVSGTVIDSDGQMIVMDAEQVGNLEATRNYVIEAQSMEFPRFVSGLYLDIGRKYYTKTNLLTILDEMTEAEMNTIFFHFSDNEGFRFGLDDMTIHANGTTYDLSVSLGKGIHAYGDPEDNNNYVTQTEMTEIMAYAKSLGIEVVPCFDMPSHMGGILKNFNDFWSSSSHTVTLSNPLAVNFAYAVLEKYLDYFQSQRCRYWCLGADEVHGYDFATNAVSAGLFVEFCNTAIKKIIRHGMLPLMFNDNIGMTNIEDKINKGVLVLYWRKKNDLGAQSIADMGYRVLNMSDTLYYVAGRTGSLNPSSFNVFRIGSDNPIDAPAGGNISIWHDNAGGIASANDGGDAAVADTAQYISDFGAVMKTQKKKVTVTVLESVTIHAGGIGTIPVTLTGTYSLKTVYDAYVSNNPSLKYIGFRNVSCKTDPINGTIKSGTAEICMVNTGESDVSLTTRNSVGIDFL